MRGAAPARRECSACAPMHLAGEQPLVSLMRDAAAGCLSIPITATPTHTVIGAAPDLEGVGGPAQGAGRPARGRAELVEHCIPWRLGSRRARPTRLEEDLRRHQGGQQGGAHVCGGGGQPRVRGQKRPTPRSVPGRAASWGVRRRRVERDLPPRRLSLPIFLPRRLISAVSLHTRHVHTRTPTQASSSTQNRGRAVCDDKKKSEGKKPLHLLTQSVRPRRRPRAPSPRPAWTRTWRARRPACRAAGPSPAA